MPWCRDVNQKCSKPDAPCKTNPTQDPLHCEQAPDCPVPPPVQASKCKGMPLTNQPANPERPAKMQDVIREAIDRQKRQCGNCTSVKMMVMLKRLAADLNARGYCTEGPWADALAILNEEGYIEEYHPVASFGGFTDSGNGKYIGAWVPNGGPKPLSNQCGYPRPNIERMKFNLGKHNGLWDSTYTTDMQCEYCDEIGLGTFNGQIRCGCPVRAEGHEQRITCEILLVGEQLWWCDGERIENSGNPAQAYCRGRVKTCSQDMKACGEAVW